MPTETQPAIADIPTYHALAGDTVMSTSLGDGMALLDLRTNQYFSLVDVGAVVWQSLQTPRTLNEIVEDVLAVYEVDRSDCVQDVDLLLSDLVGADLVKISSAAHS